MRKVCIVTAYAIAAVAAGWFLTEPVRASKTEDCPKCESAYYADALAEHLTFCRRN